MSQTHGEEIGNGPRRTEFSFHGDLRNYRQLWLPWQSMWASLLRGLKEQLDYPFFIPSFIPYPLSNPILSPEALGPREMLNHTE